jgi:serine/threonine protein kinase
MCGTQGYFTPESFTTKYSYKTDIFDFGVCIYHLMTGNTLFKDSSSSYDIVRKGEIIYDDKTKFSAEAKDLLKKIFVLDNQRIDLDKIYQHDFFDEGKGLIDVDFPDFFKIPKKDFEEKIKILEQNVKMTNVSYFPRKNTINKDENYPYMSKKSLNESDNNNKSKDFGLNE